MDSRGNGPSVSLGWLRGADLAGRPGRVSSVCEVLSFSWFWRNPSGEDRRQAGASRYLPSAAWSGKKGPSSASSIVLVRVYVFPDPAMLPTQSQKVYNIVESRNLFGIEGI
jgi:hypothetical protein